jgi:thioredoxin 1
LNTSNLCLEKSDSDFENHISEEDKSLVFFKDNMCITCDLVFRVLEEIKDKVPIYIVDVMMDRDLADKYSIRKVPTIIIFKKGRVGLTLVGNIDKTTLIKLLGKK